MPFKRVTSGPKRTKRTRGSSSQAPEADPDVEMENVNLADLEECEWPENTTIDYAIEWRDPAHKARFDHIQGRKLIPSRFIDIDTIRELGMLDEIKSLCDTIGVWDFLSTPVPTYRTLTYEFFSTCKSNSSRTKLEFYLDGTRYEISDSELNTILGFPNHDNLTIEPIWGKRLTNDLFVKLICGMSPQSNVATQIQHPILRYLQKVMANSIFGRGETSGKFFTNELYFLYCMLRCHLPAIQAPNVGHFITDHIARITQNPKKNGDISIGGIVTRIAQHLNIISDPPLRSIVTGPTSITIKELLIYKLIKREGDGYVNLGYDGNVTKLPINVPLDPKKLDTWVLFPTTDFDTISNPAFQASELHEHREARRPTAGPSSSSQGTEYSNQMIWEQLNQMNINYATLNSNYSTLVDQYANLNERYTVLSTQYDDLHAAYQQQNNKVDNVYGWAQDADRRMHDVYHITHQLHAQHFGTEPHVPPYPPSRWFPDAPPPPED